MKQKLLIIITVFFIASKSFAQQNNATLKGVVKDNTGKLLSGATIMLHQLKDSALIKTAVTNNLGAFEILQVKAGAYFVSSTTIGTQKIVSKTINVKDGEIIEIPALIAIPVEKSLSNVTVISKKPMVEVRADKTILNVEGTINAVGNDALELLRKSPGVMVDKDDNLSLSGKNGVQVYIDGKPSPLSGADLANYLKSMQSTQIESIELITNPSAKYEAAGNAGIINIKLKKNKNYGTNGSVNAGYAIGVYSKYNGGVTLNNRNAKSNVFGNYSYNQGLNENNFNLFRILADTTFDQHNLMKVYNKYSHNFKIGSDFFINAKSTFGLVVNGNLSANDTKTNGPLEIIYNPTNTIAKNLLANNDNEGKRTNMNFNANYRYADKKARELNIDADYGFFKIRSNQLQPNTYYNAALTTILYSNVYRMISPTDIDIYSLKADYEQTFIKGKLGFGTKISFVNTDNNLSRYTVFGSTEIYDNDKSNRFKYKENINAGYVNYNKQFKGIILQAGLRVENTNSNGISTGLKNIGTTSTPNYIATENTLSRSYIDFFPSAAVTFNKNILNQWSFTYSRRIDRPAYQDLNPFEFKLNDYSYQKGNTNLLPQYTNSFGISNTYKYKLTTQLNYSHVKDIFTQIVDTTEKSKSYITKQNLANQDIISLNISYPFQYKWYSFYANVNAYYSKYKANFGGANRNISIDVYTLSYYMQNSFKLGKGFTAELTGFYNSPSVWLGTFKSKAMYGIDGGIQKTILKGKGNLKLALSDMFKLMKWEGDINFGGQYTRANGSWESRQLKLNFNYRFGNGQVKAARQHKAGIEEENKRTQSSGGLGGS